jgi:hypothetical protein
VTRPLTRSCAALASAFAVLAACAGDDTDKVKTSVLAGSAVQNVLILPLNVTSGMPPELEEAAAPVWDELEVYLRAHGMRLRTINYATVRQYWLGSIKQVRSVPGATEASYEAAAKVMIDKLGRHAEFDTVLAPTIYIAQATIEGKVARWDGVERPVTMEARSLAAKAVAEGIPLEGLAPGASIHIVVFDGEGDKIQDGRGGLELTVDVKVKQNPYSPSIDPVFRFGPREHAFEDPANLREGIALALSPFLPPLLPPKPTEDTAP